MNHLSRLLGVSSLVVITAASAGCTPPRMAVPGDLGAQGEVLEARNRSSMSGAFVDESFDLGPYKVSAVNRDWNSSSQSRSGFTFLDASHANGGHSFRLEGGSAPLAGRCFTEAEQSEAHIGNVSVSSTFHRLECRCEAGAIASSLRLESADRGLKGQVEIPGGTFPLQSVHDPEGGAHMPDAIGYRVDGPAGPAGAVEVSRPGRVWIRRGTPPEQREALTCLFAGVMLYQPPRTK